MSKLNFLTTTKRKTLYSFNPLADKFVADVVGKDRYYEYRELWRKTSKVEIELDFPLQLDIELNSSCNLKCPMCPPDIREVETKPVLMDFDLYKKIVDDGVEHGLKVVNLNFVNEPLLRKDIGKFIDYAREKGLLDVMFNTNGIFLNREMSRLLITSGLTKISVSLDAYTQATYEKIRLGGNFKKVKKNILGFLEERKNLNSKLPLLKLTYLVTAYNFHELEEFLAYWQDKADLVSLQNMTNPYDGKTRKTINEKLRFDDEQVEFDLDYHCPHPFQRMSIRYDGTVLPCCHFRGTGLVIGNVKDNSIYNIYHTTKAKKIRNHHKRGEYYKLTVCNECVKTTPVKSFNQIIY